MHPRQPILTPTTALASQTGLGPRLRADSVEALRAINLFEACTRPALRRIRRASDFAQVAEGTIIHPGNRLRWVYGLLAGTISIQRDRTQASPTPEERSASTPRSRDNNRTSHSPP
jgi:hypothetical protein